MKHVPVALGETSDLAIFAPQHWLACLCDVHLNFARLGSIDSDWPDLRLGLLQLLRLQLLPLGGVCGSLDVLAAEEVLKFVGMVSEFLHLLYTLGHTGGHLVALLGKFEDVGLVLLLIY